MTLGALKVGSLAVLTLATAGLGAVAGGCAGGALGLASGFGLFVIAYPFHQLIPLRPPDPLNVAYWFGLVCAYIGAVGLPVGVVVESLEPDTANTGRDAVSRILAKMATMFGEFLEYVAEDAKRRRWP